MAMIGKKQSLTSVTAVAKTLALLNGILLWPFGGFAYVDTVERPRERLIVTLGGPGVNLAILLILTPFMFWFDQPIRSAFMSWGDPGGNYLADENGGPVLIDPAPYYADREAELGMTTLFGGLPPRFYEIYNEFFPLNDGYQQRVLLYKLYHLLNHLNLFGNTYLADCETIVSNFN